jgi:hypothetical protein
MGPVSGVIGRTNEILNSSVVEPIPFSKVDWIASPMQLSSIVAASPPCTVPAGFRWISGGSAITTTRPFCASAIRPTLDKFQAGHLLLLVGADRPICPTGNNNLRIDVRDGAVHLAAGEMFVVPKGVEHKPYAENEVQLLLIEPRGVPNTGERGDEHTAPNNVWI